MSLLGGLKFNPISFAINTVVAYFTTPDATLGGAIMTGLSELKSSAVGAVRDTALAFGTDGTAAYMKATWENMNRDKSKPAMTVEQAERELAMGQNVRAFLSQMGLQDDASLKQSIVNDINKAGRAAPATPPRTVIVTVPQTNATGVNMDQAYNANNGAPSAPPAQTPATAPQPQAPGTAVPTSATR